ncbi:MAG: DUF2971 domain-containing protein [Candidatus Gastranaerophilaceae bacterium]|jgi:hypothetical protein|nr:DUF2971 domain-containing protein [bacterium]MEE0495390.1 DUF2971 domain-containing protein [Cyanobacteriota bacterium]CDE92862.1 putative uncharacterized protein [Fusobacterium sp. CAG:815]DAA89991.1 MAG TPA: DUF2971 domain-containing protein [Candidatus Gastranaerophilales bacterium HUM_6]DAA93752.1 MAG TPA: DUF2971 domain-containing protein [Candidatus Gastranaerophilales bacterium HUM_7]DAB02370.1 MAG TPA: DUF2971 domain-containing protein [Candidatus Gastranaerophilales bacterium HUM_1
MSYYDELLRKIPKIKKVLDNDKNYVIYHYTKPEKLLNILASGTLRFSNALYLNDKEEIAYSYKLIVDLIDETPELNSDLFNKIQNHFSNKYKHIVDGYNDLVNKLEYFTTSFSTESDNLTLWNNYAKGKNYTGYNIGFDKNKLVEEMDKNNYLPIFGSVIYDKNKQVKIIHAIFKKWNMLFERALKSKKTNEVKLFDILFELIDVLSIVSIFFKNPQFKNEHEYRIVIVNVFGTLNSKPTNIVEKNGLFVPYLEYNFSKESVKSINIGPTFDENIFYTSTNRMLLNFGYEDKEVFRSKIPLRY